MNVKSEDKGGGLRGVLIPLPPRNDTSRDPMFSGIISTLGYSVTVEALL